MVIVKRVDWLVKQLNKKLGPISVATRATPALALLASTDLTFTFDVAQPDTDYEIFVDFLGGALGKLSYVEKAKVVAADGTSTGCTLTFTAIISITATTGTLRVRAVHR